MAQVLRDQAQTARTSISKSRSILTASPNRLMYCARFANCHMLRSFCSVLGSSTGSSASISTAARLRAGMTAESAVERRVGRGYERDCQGTEGADDRIRWFWIMGWGRDHRRDGGGGGELSANVWWLKGVMRSRRQNPCPPRVFLKRNGAMALASMQIKCQSRATLQVPTQLNPAQL